MLKKYVLIPVLGLAAFSLAASAGPANFSSAHTSLRASSPMSVAAASRQLMVPTQPPVAFEGTFDSVHRSYSIKRGDWRYTSRYHYSVSAGNWVLKSFSIALLPEGQRAPDVGTHLEGADNRTQDRAQRGPKPPTWRRFEPFMPPSDPSMRVNQSGSGCVMVEGSAYSADYSFDWIPEHLDDKGEKVVPGQWQLNSYTLHNIGVTICK